MVFSHHLLNVYAVMSHAAQSLTLRLLVDLLPLFLISEWVFRVLWVKSASIQVQRGHWKQRSCSKDGLYLFTSPMCHEGILKAESGDFPYLKCPLTLVTASKRDLHRVYLAWNKWREMRGPLSACQAHYRALPPTVCHHDEGSSCGRRWRWGSHQPRRSSETASSHTIWRAQMRNKVSSLILEQINLECLATAFQRPSEHD